MHAYIDDPKGCYKSPGADEASQSCLFLIFLFYYYCYCYCYCYYYHHHLHNYWGSIRYLVLKAAVPSACRPFCLPVLTLLGLLPSICSQSPCLCSPSARGKSKLKALMSRSMGPCAQWHLSPIAHPPSSCSTGCLGDVPLQVLAHSVRALSSMQVDVVLLLHWPSRQFCTIPSTSIQVCMPMYGHTHIVLLVIQCMVM